MFFYWFVICVNDSHIICLSYLTYGKITISNLIIITMNSLLILQIYKSFNLFQVRQFTQHLRSWQKKTTHVQAFIELLLRNRIEYCAEFFVSIFGVRSTATVFIVLCRGAHLSFFNVVKSFSMRNFYFISMKSLNFNEGKNCSMNANNAALFRKIRTKGDFSLSRWRCQLTAHPKEQQHQQNENIFATREFSSLFSVIMVCNLFTAIICSWFKGFSFLERRALDCFSFF